MRALAAILAQTGASLPVWFAIVATGVITVFSGYRALRALGPQKNAAFLFTAAAGAALLVLGLRVVLANGRVSWVPYLDQWNAEMNGLLAPYAHGRLNLGHLLAGNNEHRVFLTRAMTLVLTVVNSGWDNRVLVFGNYVLEAVMAGWACLLAWAFLGRVRGSFVAAAVVIPYALACNWEGFTSSNQTQFVFMAFGTVFALSIPQDYSLRSGASLASLCAAFVTLASMASGFLAAACLAAVAVAVAILERRDVAGRLGFACACTLLVLLGWFGRAHFEALHFIYAKSVGEWFRAFLSYGAWPLPPTVWGLALLWLPFAALLFETVRSRTLPPLAGFALALGLWTILQAGALGWTRAGLSGLVSSRYTEFIGWGFCANALCAMIVWPRLPAAPGWRSAAAVVVVAWFACVAGYEAWRSEKIYRPYLEGFAAQSHEQEQRLGTYMRKADPSVITSVEFPHIPYPPAQDILGILDDAAVRPLLPAPLRRDYVRERMPSQLAATQDGPLAFLAIRVFPWGAAIATLGAALLAIGLFKLRPKESPPS